MVSNDADGAAEETADVGPGEGVTAQAAIEAASNGGNTSIDRNRIVVIAPRIPPPERLLANAETTLTLLWLRLVGSQRSSLGCARIQVAPTRWWSRRTIRNPPRPLERFGDLRFERLSLREQPD